MFHPTSYKAGTGGSFSGGLKRPEREADHSSPSSAEVKVLGAIPTLPPYVFMPWCLLKHRGNFTFTFHLYKER